MNTKWVRIQYFKDEDSDEPKISIRFIKNMKYCDFVIKE